MEVNEQKIEEKAKSLGRALGQTDKAKALKRAEENIQEEEEVSEEFEEVQKLQEELISKNKRGEDITREEQEELQELMKKLEKRPTFQQFISAQTNFEKLMQQVNQYIQEGIAEGQDSQIIEI